MEAACHPALSLYQKSVAAGFTQVTVDNTLTYIINYQSIGRKTESSSRITFKATDAQLAAFKASLEGEESEGIDLNRMGPSAGEKCPDFVVYSALDGTERRLTWTEADSKVYLLDFWATWCGPCQKPMSHNQEMLARNPSWADRVEIIAISLDDTKDEAQQRIQERSWTSITHCWGGSAGFQAASPSLFCVKAIPTCLLVKKGKILWRGHPDERDLEAEIAHLLTHDDLIPIPAETPGQELTFEGQILGSKLDRIEQLFSEFVAAGSLSPFFVYVLTTTKKESAVTVKGIAISGGTYPTEKKGSVEALVVKIKEEFPVLSERFHFS